MTCIFTVYHEGEVDPGDAPMYAAFFTEEEAKAYVAKNPGFVYIEEDFGDDEELLDRVMTWARDPVEPYFPDSMGFTP